MRGSLIAHITAGACVPEQLTHYVTAVSGRKAQLHEQYITYSSGRHCVLVAYPDAGRESSWPTGQWDWSPCGQQSRVTGDPPSLLKVLDGIRQTHDAVTLIAPYRPREAPDNAASLRDCYFRLDLPSVAGQKLRNMLKRASRDVSIGEEPWSGEHAALVHHYLANRPLASGTHAIYTALPEYLRTAALFRGSSQTADCASSSEKTATVAHATYSGAAPQRTKGPVDAELGQKMYFEAAPGVLSANLCLVCARNRDGALAAFAIGDYSGLQVAFYMFAFRKRDAPPGTADLLLQHLVRKAEDLGHVTVNFGLGITAGIAFFKRKWGAQPYLPYVETSWAFNQRPGPGLFARLKRRLSLGGGVARSEGKLSLRGRCPLQTPLPEEVTLRGRCPLQTPLPEEVTLRGRCPLRLPCRRR